jgi:hypothetical protein
VYRAILYAAAELRQPAENAQAATRVLLPSAEFRLDVIQRSSRLLVSLALSERGVPFKPGRCYAKAMATVAASASTPTGAAVVAVERRSSDRAGSKLADVEHAAELRQAGRFRSQHLVEVRGLCPVAS